MAVTPQCPTCKADLPPLAPPGGLAACPDCATGFETFVYPAAAAPRRLIEPVPAREGEATCFFHPTQRADQTCDQCGRMLCPVCTVAVPSGWSCPACAVPGTKAKGRKSTDNERINYPGIATIAMFLSLVIWPLAVITGPLVIGILIYGARQPRSLVRPGLAPSWLLGILAAFLTVGSAIFWLSLFAGANT